jgi:hypothetical protein
MSDTKKPGWMREAMPKVARMVDEHRARLGNAHVQACVVAGMRGEPNQFYAIEAGHVVGAPFTDVGLMQPVGLAFALGGAAIVMRGPEGGFPPDPDEVDPFANAAEALRININAPAKKGAAHGAH